MRPTVTLTAGVLTLTAATSLFALFAVGQAAAPAGGRAAAAIAAQQARPRVSVGSQGALPTHAVFSAEDAKRGGDLFVQNCAFCHGKDAGGGETGPDLTRSAFVTEDKDGENIGTLLHTGRLEKGMPRFDFNAADTKALVAFVHSQQDAFLSQTGTRKGVEIEDLQTGNVAAGQQYFNGAGGCSKCHMPEGDLKGIATKYTGLTLEQRMLIPRGAKATVTITLPNGKTLTGLLLYHDEFTIALTDADGTYHSFLNGSVHYKIDDPAHAHVDLLGKYTDDDIHNLMAYIQTLK
jgi:cytochrome c oxidase cbb3-type subunit 3